MRRIATAALTALPLTVLPLISAHAWQAPSSPDVSAVLVAMYEADQAERRTGRLSPENDRLRLARVKALLAADSITAGPDYYHAAMVLQHSTDRTGRDHLLAHVLSTLAAVKGHEEGRWLAAAALDRFLVFNQMEQFFGTQFERDDQGQWRPGHTDPGRTERLRTEFHIPPHDSLELRARGFNR